MPTSWTGAPATGRPWMSITRPRIGTSSLARRSSFMLSPTDGSTMAGPYPSAMITNWAERSTAAFTASGESRNEPLESLRVSRTGVTGSSSKKREMLFERYTSAPAAGCAVGVDDLERHSGAGAFAPLRVAFLSGLLSGRRPERIGPDGCGSQRQKRERQNGQHHSAADPEPPGLRANRFHSKFAIEQNNDPSLELRRTLP